MAQNWARESVSAMGQAGIELPELSGNLTRIDAAELLYSAERTSARAPGLTVFRLDWDEDKEGEG